jgi:hypothetical protein
LDLSIPLSDFPNLNGSLLSIDDPRIDPLNPSRLKNPEGRAEKDLLLLSHAHLFVCEVNGSSLIILGGSLRANRTYQWIVQIPNQRNSVLQGTDFLLLRIEDTQSPLIVIG